MKRNTTLLFFLLLFSQVLPAFSQESVPVGHSQDPAFAGLAHDLDQYRSQRIREKIFVHTDKDSYLAGEICWYKLYVVEAGDHRPLDLSKVAYLEWLDKDNKAVLQAKIGLSDGRGDGSLYLPLALRSGNYKLRAYTSWMKNYGADWFFEKALTIINSRRSAEAPAAPPPPRYTVDLFPEGGNLVENIASKIAFRITDQYGKGVECTAVVTEDDQDTVVRFRPHRFGIGSFAFTPRPGHRYRSIFRLADGTAVNQLLPSAYKEGMVMKVTAEAGDRLRVELQAIPAPGLSGSSSLSGSSGSSNPAGTSAASGSSVYLIAHTRRSVKVAEAAELKDGRALFIVDKHNLGEGVSHLTVFNANKQPVCERLVFKSPSRLLNISVATDKLSYPVRSKISLQVNITGESTAATGTGTIRVAGGDTNRTTLNNVPTPGGAINGPQIADCSLSVFRLDSLQRVPADHISDWLWLASDLKGRIESPAYYFDHPEDEEAIDNLMISHGWRRFRWEDVLRHSAPSFQYPPEFNGAILSGRIVDARANPAEAKNILTYVSVPGTRTQFSTARSDDEGRVRLQMKDFYGSQEIVVQTNPVLDSLKVDIANPFSETYTDNPLPFFELPPQDSTMLSDKSVAMQVVNKYGGEKLKQFRLPEDIDTTVFYYQPDETYLLDNYTRFITMEEVMREYVKFMLVKKRGAHFHLPLLDIRNVRMFENDPLILVDGVPVTDIDTLMAMDPLKIRKLEMVNEKFFLGSATFDGIMNWTTYKGDLGGYVLDPRVTVLDYEGLQLKREFYSPSYETPEAVASHVPDFRNLLYWAPTIPTADSTGHAGCQFFSSDLPGKYVVVVEGLSADGKTGSALASFEVK